MDTEELTAARFDDAVRWMSGGISSMDEREVKAFLDAMVAGFRRRFSEVRPGAAAPRFRHYSGGTCSLSSLAGMDADTASRILGSGSAAAARDEGNIVASSVDSVTLADAICHVAAESGVTPSSSRVHMILYCVYGSWLASHGTRLDVERPQAWRYGPVFPRAYRECRPDDSGRCLGAYVRLREAAPELAELTVSRTLSMLHSPMGDLRVVHVTDRSSPYMTSLRDNDGKTGCEIPDSLIGEWFRRGRP